MALSSSRLITNYSADLVTQFNILFPVNTSLTAGEQAAATSSLQKLAGAIANALAPDVVSEITGHMVVNPGTMAVIPANMSNLSGPLTGNGLVAVGTGTAS